MKTETELFENALDTTSVNGKKLREYINENYTSNLELNKIRAEIIENSIEDYIFHGCGTDELIIETSEVLRILDKYKEEKEEKE